MVTYTYGDANWGDNLTAYDGNTITYDGVGNLQPLPQIQSNSIKAAPEYTGAVLLSFRVCRCPISLQLFILFGKPRGI